MRFQRREDGQAERSRARGGPRDDILCPTPTGFSGKIGSHARALKLALRRLLRVINFCESHPAEGPPHNGVFAYYTPRGPTWSPEFFCASCGAMTNSTGPGPSTGSTLLRVRVFVDFWKRRSWRRGFAFVSPWTSPRLATKKRPFRLHGAPAGTQPLPANACRGLPTVRRPRSCLVFGCESACFLGLGGRRRLRTLSLNAFGTDSYIRTDPRWRSHCESESLHRGRWDTFADSHCPVMRPAPARRVPSGHVGRTRAVPAPAGLKPRSEPV